MKFVFQDQFYMKKKKYIVQINMLIPIFKYRSYHEISIADAVNKYFTLSQNNFSLKQSPYAWNYIVLPFTFSKNKKFYFQVFFFFFLYSSEAKIQNSKGKKRSSSIDHCAIFCIGPPITLKHRTSLFPLFPSRLAIYI